MKRFGLASALSGVAAAAMIFAAAPHAAAQATAHISAPGWQAEEAGYLWIDNADALLDAIGDAPPDFAFSYAGGEAWGWRTRTGHEVYAEPLSGGALRYYYFDPDVRAPFLVQDDGVSFGYRDGRMEVAYDRDGRLLAPRESDRHWTLAARLYSRGRAIRAAALYEDRWDDVDAGWWAGQIATVIELRLRWQSGRNRHAEWRGWQARPETMRRRGALAQERDARRASGERFRQWQREGFRGQPPRFGNERAGRPGGWNGRGLRPPQQGWRPGAVTAPGGRPDTGPGTSPGAGRPQRPDAGMPGTGRPGWTPDASGRPPRQTPPAQTRPPQQSPGTERQRPSDGTGAPQWRRDGGNRPGGIGNMPRREGGQPPAAVAPRPAPPPAPPPAASPQPPAAVAPARPSVPPQRPFVRDGEGRGSGAGMIRQREPQGGMTPPPRPPVQTAPRPAPSVQERPPFRPAPPPAPAASSPPVSSPPASIQPTLPQEQNLNPP